ncbi:MAG: outer membrane beta-barrel protein [Gemmatimonadota bacterium]
MTPAPPGARVGGTFAPSTDNPSILDVEMTPRYGFVPLLVLWALAMAPGASGQLAIRGGINLTDLVGGGVEESENRMGLNVGAGFDVLHFGPLSLGAEVHYAQRGAEAFQAFMGGSAVPGSSPPEIPQGPVEIALEYVEIPVVARLRIPLASRLQPYVMGGPVFGWQLDCSVTVDAQAGGADPVCDDLLTREGFDEKVREYEQGLFLGAGLGLEIFQGLGSLTLEGRYIQGMSRLSEGTEGPEVRNRGFSLMLGYALGR